MIQNSTELDTLIIDTLGSIVVVIDREGRIVRFNSGGTRILGYQPEEVLGKIIWDAFTPPEYREISIERCRSLLTGESLEFECEWLTRDGQRKQLHFLCKGVCGPSGEMEYIIGTATDVTDRIEAAAALRDSEDRFRTSFNDAAIGMALVDDAGRYLHVNKAFCALTGYEEHELLKMDMFSITHPDDRTGNSQLFRQAFAGKMSNYVFEKRYIRRNGDEVWVQVSASMMQGSPGRPATMIGLFENISERKHTHKALLMLTERLESHVRERTADLQARTEQLASSQKTLIEQDRILRSILHSMGDGVYVADETGRVTVMNPAAEALTGPIAPGSETIADRARRPWFFRSDGMTPFAPDELQLCRSVRGEVIDDEEVLILRPGYPQKWVSATGRPLRDDSGKVRGAVLVIRDISERRRNEAAVRDFNASLANANESLRERERHYKELAESHLRLAREVEHRVRNNLQGLLGLISATRDRATDVRTFAAAMESRLAAMCHVHQLLAEARWTNVGLRALVDGALGALRYVAPHPATTTVRGPDALICPRQVLPLTLILAEWFTNSCKYGAHSIPGGSLSIGWEVNDDSAAPLIRLTWTEHGGPPVRTPVVPSLGTELVQGFVRKELAGKCELRYPREGASHMLEFAWRREGE